MDHEPEAAGEVCHKERALDAPGLFQNGDATFRLFHIGWIICGFLAIIATVVSMWLVNKHLQWYTNKREQRYIIRLLFLVPLYAVISFGSFLFWNHATPLILLRDAYEAIVLTAFFYLLLMYLSHDLNEQKAIFRRYGLSREADREAIRKGESPQTWVWPMGFIKWKPEDGFYFLQLMKWGVLQYCVVRPLSTLAAVILDYMGLYCEESWGFGWGHVWIVVLISISVTIAMYCLIQLYVTVAKELAPHRPLLKLFSVKAVVFLTFWQATFLSVLSMFGVIKDSQYMTSADINIGIGALLECFEMVLFAFLHIKAFTYKVYRPLQSPNSRDPPPRRTHRWRSLLHAFDFRDTFREIWAGYRYMWDRLRGRQPADDFEVRRAVHFEEAFGRQRHSNIERKPLHEEQKGSGPSLPTVEVEVKKQVELNGERQWLGLDENYGYGVGNRKRERSESLGMQISRELEKRGYPTMTNAVDGYRPLNHGANHERQLSWWRSIYNRISSGSTHEPRPAVSSQGWDRDLPPQPIRVAREPKSHQRLLQSQNINLDDPPPESLGPGKRGRPTMGHIIKHGRWNMDLDVTAPPSVLPKHKTTNSGQMAPVLEIPGLPPRNQPLSTPKVLRKDSLLARIFPAHTNTEPSITGHTSDGGMSPPSVSQDEAAPFRAIPRTHLANKPLVIGLDGNQRNALPVDVGPGAAGILPQSATFVPSPPPPPAPLILEESQLHARSNNLSTPNLASPAMPSAPPLAPIASPSLVPITSPLPGPLLPRFQRDLPAPPHSEDELPSQSIFGRGFHLDSVLTSDNGPRTLVTVDKPLPNSPEHISPTRYPPNAPPRDKLTIPAPLAPPALEPSQQDDAANRNQQGRRSTLPPKPLNIPSGPRESLSSRTQTHGINDNMYYERTQQIQPSSVPPVVRHTPVERSSTLTQTSSTSPPIVPLHEQGRILRRVNTVRPCRQARESRPVSYPVGDVQFHPSSTSPLSEPQFHPQEFGVLCTSPAPLSPPVHRALLQHPDPVLGQHNSQQLRRPQLSGFGQPERIPMPHPDYALIEEQSRIIRRATLEMQSVESHAQTNQFYTPPQSPDAQPQSLSPLLSPMLSPSVSPRLSIMSAQVAPPYYDHHLPAFDHSQALPRQNSRPHPGAQVHQQPRREMQHTANQSGHPRSYPPQSANASSGSTTSPQPNSPRQLMNSPFPVMVNNNHHNQARPLSDPHQGYYQQPVRPQQRGQSHPYRRSQPQSPVDDKIYFQSHDHRPQRPR